MKRYKFKCHYAVNYPKMWMKERKMLINGNTYHVQELGDST
jgi:hypothetical protein